MGKAFNIYLKDGGDKIASEMQPGELSRICLQAVKEYNEGSNDLKIVEKQIKNLKKERKNISKKLIFLQKRAIFLQKKEEENRENAIKQLEIEEKFTQEVKVRNDKVRLETYTKALLKIFKVSEDDAIKFAKEYIKEKPKGSFKNHFIKKGLFLMEKEK